MIWIVIIVVFAVIFAPIYLPLFILPRLTGGRLTGRSLDFRDAWGEIWVELKARRLVAKLRRDGEL